jgi:HlyD family secretion protein
MKIPKWLIFAVAVVVIVVGSVYFYKNDQSGEAAENNIKYKEFTVTRGTFQTEVSANGVVTPIDRVQIKSKASGRIDNLPVEEGDFVKKDQLICRLDPTDVQAEVDQAKANLDIAQAELTTAQNTYDRQMKLFDKSLISAEARDQATLALAQAKGKMVSARISLDQANTRLSETTVRSPIDGVILQKYVEVGQIIASGISNVSGGTAIADIASMANVYVEAGIDEIDVGKINIGQPAKIVAEAYPRLTFHGKIIRIAPEATVEQNVTLFNVVIEVENKEGKLKSGMNATAEITVAKEDNVLLVPTLALSPVEGPDSRFTRQTFLKKGNEYVPQNVEVGLSDFKETVVQKGLNEGDVVGVPMVSRLKEQNDEMEQRIRSMRSFGTSGSSDSSSRGRR